MEEFENEIKKEKKSRWTTYLLLINMFIWGFILIFAFFFFGILKVNALTPVEMNFNFDSNGSSVTYNIRPDGGSTGFIYENEFFGQEIAHSSYRYYKLPASTFKTNNINGYFQNPCNSGQDISYTMKINFYKQPTDTNTMAWVSVVNGIDGCTGYFEVINGVYTYNNVCNLGSGDVPKFSLYFNESNNGMTYYRVGVPVNFSYTCQVGNQAIIDSNNANTNKIINKLDSISGGWVSEMSATYERVNPDTADFQSYESSENQLYSLVSSADVDNVQVDIDSSSSGSFWDLVDRVVHTNTLVFGLLIGALSVGIIKLVLGR